MIPAWAAQYIGLPFSEKGSSKEEGYNCWTLARAIQSEQFGVELPAYDVYHSTKDVEAIESTIHQQIEYWTDIERQWVFQTTPSPGALLFFRMGGRVVHVGTVLDEQFMIHVLRGIDVCIGRYTDKRWRPRCIGCYQHYSRL